MSLWMQFSNHLLSALSPANIFLSHYSESSNLSLSSPASNSHCHSLGVNLGSEDGFASGDGLNALGDASADGDTNAASASRENGGKLDYSSTPIWKALLVCATSPEACTGETAAMIRQFLAAAINCSCYTLETILSLCIEVEETRNASQISPCHFALR
ncbi:hypothetical protein OG21DRAFT_1525483 [Imleria badia]|nr:hypothetical protein OG21DRAFT_1525483 [Imleria badia]